MSVAVWNHLVNGKRGGKKSFANGTLAAQMNIKHIKIVIIKK